MVKIKNNLGEMVEVSEEFAKAFHEAQKFGEEVNKKWKSQNPKYINDFDLDEDAIKTDKIEKSEKNQIKGGLADNLSIKDIADKHNVDINKIKAQISKGILVEMEHTNDPKKAVEIALDHLVESPIYYDELEKMESKFHDKK